MNITYFSRQFEYLILILNRLSDHAIGYIAHYIWIIFIGIYIATTIHYIVTIDIIIDYWLRHALSRLIFTYASYVAAAEPQCCHRHAMPVAFHDSCARSLDEEAMAGAAIGQAVPATLIRHTHHCHAIYAAITPYITLILTYYIDDAAFIIDILLH